MNFNFYIASRYQAFTYICNWLTIYVYPPFSTNFEELFLYEREVWVQIDENSYWTPRQFWVTQIGIKLLAFVSPEKFAFPCEVFLKFCLIFVYHTFCYQTFLTNFGALYLSEFLTDLGQILDYKSYDQA